MREFTPEYLEHTRRGMWESTAALDPLELDSRARVLDVGCGTGELSRVLAAESPGDVIGVDADTALLGVAREATGLPTVAGDATRLPFRADAADLVVCQALLINLPDPTAAVREFARVSSDLVAAIEPDNAAVEVSSTVDAEERLEREVREAYLAGVETDVAMGERVGDLFEAAGLDVIARRTYHHEKLVEPPYSEPAMESAAKKASGAGIAEHERELRAAGADYDDLRAAWREMGRDVVRAMGEERYRRREVVPFEVTVGRV
ncbi:ubiquinone/menaquinone biosynthesis methyltransferase [Halolamina pelagica]|uniref:Ubiquinone/menaquinone biosynthesis methyltransferase n=1 Tax=Halolamina pelagica TaxID=699431 RepID=A0A0N8HZL9_9EURY|nr:class I SAM-dependent methyltransferase [Halolamina pelagica]KPN29875.1 ubiquinone/menaquinone biosynthesis methyltransferase [Halolamina pelagica]